MQVISLSNPPTQPFKPTPPPRLAVDNVIDLTHASLLDRINLAVNDIVAATGSPLIFHSFSTFSESISASDPVENYQLRWSRLAPIILALREETVIVMGRFQHTFFLGLFWELG